MLTRRQAVAADAPALLEMYVAYDTAELGQPEMELPNIEGMLALTDSDRVLVEDDGRLVGFADVGRSGEVETVVMPSYDGSSDLQRELLDWALARARERGIGRIEHFAGTSAEGATARLRAAGFEHARTIWRMARSVAGELPTPVWPAGVSPRPFDRQRDGHKVWQVVMESFAGTFGSHPRPFEEWSTLVLDQGFDVVCAVEHDVIVAVATTHAGQGEGNIGQLGVLPEHRGRGLGLALLHECFRRDAAAGLATTTLTVDGENALARRLYEKAGMAVVAEYRRYERDL